jgi:hypothetical protein
MTTLDLSVPIREQVLKAVQTYQALQTAVLARLSNITQNPEVINKLGAFLTQYISHESMLSDKLSLLDEGEQQCVINAVILICLCKPDVKSSLYTLQMVMETIPQRPQTIIATLPFDAPLELAIELYHQAVADADEALHNHLDKHQERVDKISGELIWEIEFHMRKAMNGDEDPCQENTIFREIVCYLDMGNPDTETLVQLCQSALTLMTS